MNNIAYVVDLYKIKPMNFIEILKDQQRFYVGLELLFVQTEKIAPVANMIKL